MRKFRKLPPICQFVSLIKVHFGKLRLSKEYVGTKVKMDDQKEFEPENRQLDHYINNHKL